MTNKLFATPLKYVFLVQGEGRGHMTQAIALSEILEKAGNDVCHVFVGSKKSVPEFFKHELRSSPVELIHSPGFVTDKNTKGVLIWATIARGIANFLKYIRSIRRIHEIVLTKKPDVILNFYEPVGGLYNFCFRPRVKSICIGHQYLAHHQAYEFAPGVIDKWLFLMNNKLTGIGAEKLLALSFSSHKKPKNRKIKVLPPLLRKAVKQQGVNHGDFLLAYILNQGYAQELMDWHKKNRQIKLHCFWDNQDVEDEFRPHPNLTFHQLDDKKFITLMSECKGYVSTAGFESICEAKYMGKPVMTVPVAGHYEQSCNAIDANNAGAGITSDSFNLSDFLHFIDDFKAGQNEFRGWVSLAESEFLNALALLPETASVRKDRPLVQRPLVLPQHAH